MPISSSQLRQSYEGVDLLKFIAAVIVVTCHAPSLFWGYVPYPPLMEALICWRLTFFFCASGFFLMRKLDVVDGETDTERRMRQRSLLLTRSGVVFRLWAVWIVLYLIAGLAAGVIASPGDLMLNLREVFVNGWTTRSWQLWFMYASAIALLMLAMSWGRRGPLAIVLGISTLSIVCRWLSDIRGIVVLAPIHYSLFAALPLVMGMMIWRLHAAGRLNWQIKAAMCVLSVAAVRLHLPFFQIIAGATVFVLSLGLTRLPRRLPDAKLLRNLSLWMFYSHMFVGIAMQRLLPPTYLNITHRRVLWLTFVTGSILLALLCHRLQHSRRLSAVGYLVKA